MDKIRQVCNSWENVASPAKQILSRRNETRPQGVSDTFSESTELSMKSGHDRGGGIWSNKCGRTLSIWIAISPDLCNFRFILLILFLGRLHRNQVCLHSFFLSGQLFVESASLGIE